MKNLVESHATPFDISLNGGGQKDKIRRIKALMILSGIVTDTVGHIADGHDWERYGPEIKDGIVAWADNFRQLTFAEDVWGAGPTLQQAFRFLGLY